MIVQGKNTGRQAGFRAVDADNPDGPMFQIEFDPAGNPEMATGAEIIGTAVYHALGYNVVDVYLIDLDPGTLTIAPAATIEVAGAHAPLHAQDLEQVLTPSRPQAGRPLPRDGQPLRRRAPTWARSATTARAPTIRTTSTRTNTAASCAATACSPRG